MSQPVPTCVRDKAQSASATYVSHALTAQSASATFVSHALTGRNLVYTSNIIVPSGGSKAV